jgi:hypothetical protein
MFFVGDKLIAKDNYKMSDGECLMTIGKKYQIGYVNYNELSFSITDDFNGEIVIGFYEANELFDLENIIEKE